MCFLRGNKNWYCYNFHKLSKMYKSDSSIKNNYHKYLLWSWQMFLLRKAGKHLSLTHSWELHYIERKQLLNCKLYIQQVRTVNTVLLLGWEWSQLSHCTHYNSSRNCRLYSWRLCKIRKDCWLYSEGKERHMFCKLWGSNNSGNWIGCRVGMFLTQDQSNSWEQGRNMNRFHFHWHRKIIKCYRIRTGSVRNSWYNCLRHISRRFE